MDPLSPNRTITIAGKEYVLDGSFGTLRKLQEHFGKDIVPLLIGIPDMGVTDVADLIAVASGQTERADEIGQRILDDVGPLRRAEYLAFKTNLIAWLNAAMTPLPDREKKRAEWDAKIAKFAETSRGESTANSASGSSDGPPPSSGQPTSGT